MKIIKTNKQYQFKFGKNAELLTNLMQSKKDFENGLTANNLQVIYDQESNQITIFKTQNENDTELYFPEILPVIVAIAFLTNQPLASLLSRGSLFYDLLSNLCTLNDVLENTELTSLYQYTKGRYLDFPHHNFPDSIAHRNIALPYNCNEIKISVKHPATGIMHDLNSKLISGEGPKGKWDANRLIALLNDNLIKQVVILGPAYEDGRSKHHEYYNTKNAEFTFAKNIEKSTEEVVVYQRTDGMTVHHFTKIEDMGTFKFSSNDTSKSACIAAELADVAKTQPVFIHCSAGLGRTGAFILGIILHNYFDLFAHLDVNQQFDLISQIWDQMNFIRPGMIQSKAQFINAFSIADTLNGGTAFFNSMELLNKFFPNAETSKITIVRYNRDRTEATVITEGFGSANSYVKKARKLYAESTTITNLIDSICITDSENSQSDDDESSRDYSDAEIIFNESLAADIPILKSTVSAMLTISPEFLPQQDVSDNPGNNTPKINYVANQMTFVPASAVTTPLENSAASTRDNDKFQIS